MFKKRNLIFLCLLILGVFLITGCWLISTPTYTVTFNSQGGSAVDSQTVEHGGLVTEPTAPTKEGHTFGGWYKESECTNPWDFTTDTVISDVTLYAQWTINTYTVTFDKNGGDTEADPMTKTATHGGNVGTLPTAPTRTGYTFASWNTQADGGGTEFTATTAVTADLTVYAQWTINTYTVTFDKNDAGAAGTMADQTIASGSSANLKACTFTKTGWTFAGWAETPGGDVSYADQASYTMRTADVTLYAKWTINTYTVTFDKNGGDTEADPMTKTAEHGGNVGTLPTAPTRTGYTFASWNTEADGSGIEFTATTAVTADLTLYAQWTRSDATLSDLTVDGTTIAGFDPATLDYSKELPYGTTTVPTVGATTTDSNASKVITQAASVNGTATVVVTAEDGTTTKTYTVTFSVAANTDATLSDLTVDGTTITGFNPATLDYSKELPYGTTTVPTVGATTTDSNASKVITQAASVTGTATVVVTAEDGTTTKTYTVTFSVAAKPVHNLTKGTYYDTIEAALDDADSLGGDIIEVADGTYDESITFPSSKEIILQSASGNPDSAIIQGAANLPTVTISGSSSGTTIRGFTIKHNNTGNPSGYTILGRGIEISSGSLIVDNCVISCNKSSVTGGGIYTEGTLTITGSTISNNSANNGGGIAICQSSPTITYNTISGNNSGTNGGGIYIHDNSSPTITYNTISGNNSGTNGKGGGIAIYGDCSPTITYNTISGNTGKYGGGISIYGSSVSPPIITDNTISGNNSDNGGGIYITNNSSPDIKSNTISGNECTNNGGGIYVTATSSPDIKSNTISGNECTNNGGGIYVSGTSNLSTIGGVDENDNANFNTICGNTPDQIDPDTYPNNYIFTNCDVIGETGPAGGLIFYDKGYVSDGWRYLEAAPGDQSASAQWGCYGSPVWGSVWGADGTAVGTGEQNTSDILAACATADAAADICANLSLGGYSDWFLPSKDELNLMYTNLHNIVPPVGGFAVNIYWSSSEATAYLPGGAWAQRFSDGYQSFYDKYDTYRVRAVRAFNHSSI